MDNNFDNIPENNENSENQQEQQPYTYYQPESSDKKDYQQQYQDNYNYNVGNNTGYNTSYDTGMDTTPLTMGEWLLTIFLLSIPCVNIVLYCVWAFGKNGNINRRNYCRAGLILVAIGYVIAIIIAVIAGIATATAGSLYY
ncbi:hypothetical protein [Faecalicatena contorta]|uniref:hypothetical protein n=1 Tax=Faecalicatena contorta TaxID=39482 RepID=UPI001F205F57|nr:hypothetical protein [Faecalicatena contorta]